MKKSILIATLGIFAIGTVTSCKKNYTCTCTVVVSAGSTDYKHDINNSNYADAVKSCKNYEDQANGTLPGSTTCRL